MAQTFAFYTHRLESWERKNAYKSQKNATSISIYLTSIHIYVAHSGTLEISGIPGDYSVNLYIALKELAFIETGNTRSIKDALAKCVIGFSK